MPALKSTLSLALVGCLAGGVLGGCADVDVPSQAIVTTDTIDGVVHVANHGSGAWTPETAWRVREVFRLGGRAEPTEQLFTSQLLGTAISPRGEVYVLDHLAGSVSVFGASGRLIRTVGRRGRGPSDLATPTGFTWSDDGHLWVSDPGNRKYVVFDSTGAMVGTHPRSVQGYPRRQYPLVHDPAFGIIDEAAWTGSLVLLRTTVNGELHDTLMIVDRTGGPSQAVMDAARTLAGRPRSAFDRVGRHYVSRMKWAIDPSGTIWTGSPHELRFIKRDWNGDTLLVVTADHRDAALTPEDEELISIAMRQGDLNRDDINPIRPLFQALHVLEGGYLLVQLVDTPGVASPRFDVYEPTGRYLGELDLGFAPDPLGTLGSRGDLIVAPMLGDLDVPYAVGVELVRPSPERSGPS
jgi:hypothetical protein